MAELSVEIADGIATVTLDRPPVNALTMALYLQIAAEFRAVGERPEVRCVVLRATGKKAFCAGFDFKLFAASAGEDDPGRPLALRAMLEAVRNCAVPVIAAINGPALGAGCVLASVCDICVAAENASFSIPEIDFGRVGGGAYVGRRVPQGSMRFMAFTGRAIGAAEAYRTGLVDFLVPVDELAAKVAELAAQIASKSPQALRHMKRALNQIEFMPVDAGYEIEQMHSMVVRALPAGGSDDA